MSGSDTPYTMNNNFGWQKDNAAVLLMPLEFFFLI
jgi:hypothetical protein